MACNCGKNPKLIEYDKVRKMAITESEKESVKYVIYEIDGKITYDRKECWEKAGRNGRLRETILPI